MLRISTLQIHCSGVARLKDLEKRTEKQMYGLARAAAATRGTRGKAGSAVQEHHTGEEAGSSFLLQPPGLRLAPLTGRARHGAGAGQKVRPTPIPHMHKAGFGAQRKKAYDHTVPRNQCRNAGPHMLELSTQGNAP